MVDFATVELPAEHSTVLTGDWHAGNPACSYSALDFILDYVADDPNRYMLGMGDYIEGRKANDKRFDMDLNVAAGDMRMLRPARQWQFIEEKLEPIKDKILGLVEGNHDTYQEKTADFLRMMCERLGVPFLTYQGKVTVKVGGRVAYKIAAWHGWYSLSSAAKDPIQRQGNKMASAKRRLDRLGWTDAEVLAMGHVHDLMAFRNVKDVQLYDDGEEVHQTLSDVPPVVLNNGERWVHPDNRIYCVTGTTLKTHVRGASTYSSKRGYPPSPLGFVELKYKDGRLTASTRLCTEDEEFDRKMRVEAGLEPHWLEATGVEIKTEDEEEAGEDD